jgi:predicted aconitase
MPFKIASQDYPRGDVHPMILTQEDKSCLEGKGGEAQKLAMEVLVEVGESFGADRLTDISSAHILGHYGSLHQAGIDFLERLVAGGGKVQVPTTVDPSSVDFRRWQQFRIPKEYIAQQRRLQVAVEALGVIPSWSCTPYHSLNVPRIGENIAWAESSAVAYANSVIGARTNRTPFGLDICSAITGKIPEFGLYLSKNRKGSLLFDVKVGDLSDLDYHTLGAVVGTKSGTNVPVINGIPSFVTNDQLKCFGAGAASAGSVALYHVVGITPEARFNDPFSGRKPEEVFTITGKDLRDMEETITTSDPNFKVDMVTLGCPLLSIEELKAIYQKLQDRLVKKGVYFWIYLAQETYDMCNTLGIIQPLEKAGVWFSTQTCATISPIKEWGFRSIMTNSAKCALVVPSEHNVTVHYKNTDECILAATEPAKSI